MAQTWHEDGAQGGQSRAGERPAPEGGRGGVRVAAVHGMSCYVRCSLAEIGPVLSVMGHQCCPLPTAVLSSHTGGFSRIARTQLSGQLAGTLEQWTGLGLRFEGVYTGYLASEDQLALAQRCIAQLKGPGGLAVVDPVMGDHGRLYTAITPALAQGMGALCRQADLITPNLTEAAVLLGHDPGWRGLAGEGLAEALSQEGRRSVVVTGVCPAPGQIGAAWFDRDSGRTGTLSAPQAEGCYPGTGDLFAAVLTGGMLRGDGFVHSVELAAEFVSRCAHAAWVQGRPPREGVPFEGLLGMLLPR